MYGLAKFASESNDKKDKQHAAVHSIPAGIAGSFTGAMIGDLAAEGKEKERKAHNLAHAIVNFNSGKPVKQGMKRIPTARITRGGIGALAGGSAAYGLAYAAHKHNQKKQTRLEKEEGL